MEKSNESPSGTDANDVRSSFDVDHTPQQRPRISGAIGIGTGTISSEERALASALLKTLFGEEVLDETPAEPKQSNLKPVV